MQAIAKNQKQGNLRGYADRGHRAPNSLMTVGMERDKQEASQKNNQRYLVIEWTGQSRMRKILTPGF